MSRTIDAIATEVVARLREAFDLGRQAGLSELAAQISASIGGQPLTHSVQSVATPSPGPINVPKKPRGAPAGAPRAPRGSVKTAVLNAVQGSPSGIRSSDVATVTSVKQNSVQGTLYALKKSGQIELRGDMWYPVGGAVTGNSAEVHAAQSLINH